jgi:hypothetical protein
MSEKPVFRPNRNGRLRLRAKTARRRFIETDVTTKEHNQIQQYCLKHKISVSQFLADLILKDAAAAKRRKKRVCFTLDFTLSAKEYDKLELLVHLRQKESIGKLIQDIIRPHLELQRFHVPTRTKSLRLYLSGPEHETVTKYIASRGSTARKYVSSLAIREMAKVRTPSKQ